MAIYEDEPTSTQSVDTDPDSSVQPSPEIVVTPDQTASAETGTDYQAMITKLDELHISQQEQNQLQTDQNGLLIFLIGLIAGVTFMSQMLKGWYRA